MMSKYPYTGGPFSDWVNQVETAMSTNDDVNNPAHYTVGGYEALDVVKAKLTPEEYRGYCKGNILKYVMRANYKGHHDQDCNKAEFYAKELANALDDKQVKSPVSWTDAEQVREEDSTTPPF